MNFSVFKILGPCILYVSFLYTAQADLVKVCQNFKRTFLQACQIIDENNYTNEIKFLKENLTTGGSVIFYGIIYKAIDDCITLLPTQNDPEIQEICKNLIIFKDQIDSEFMYDLNTGVVVKKELTRSGSTRVLHLPYNDTRCYKVLH
jgi:hypothetical protein